MAIKILEKTDKKWILSITNITAIQMNTLRRTILDYVPTMAIEDLEIKKNSSVLYDEMIAHRLGLLPLETDLKSYNLPETCTCEGAGCAKCTLVLTLKVKGPKTVYASDLKSKDPKVVPVHPKTPIVKLAEGQNLELIATARLGYGKQHAKWSPGTAWYTFAPEIKVNTTKNLEEFREKYPPQIFDRSGKIKKELINTPQLIDACEGVCDDIVKITYNETACTFFIESWGQLHPKDIMIQASLIIDAKSNELLKALKKL